jgi:hypothetical protein
MANVVPLRAMIISAGGGRPNRDCRPHQFTGQSPAGPWQDPKTGPAKPVLRRLAQALSSRQVHALPFTTHTELLRKTWCGLGAVLATRD